MTPEPIVSPESINVMDPPHSSRVRRLASQAFTQQRVDEMRERIVLLADSLLDEMAQQGPPADLVQHLSNPFPQHTILHLLGIPRDGRHMEHEHVVAGLAAAHRAGALTADAVALEARKAAEGESFTEPAKSLQTRPVQPQDETGGTVTFLSDWKLSHLPPDNRPLPSVAHYDQLLKRHGRTAGEKEGS
ncbi:hypothetical protein [Streptomyces sp. NPDC058086]|uniref:hypothetical protein n=1 Tax=Streptomyces sp. NPDC058086 TaxID=3346334 RepID=UPI0036ED2208